MSHGLEIRIVVRCLLLATLIHAVGVTVVQVRSVRVPDFIFTDYLILPERLAVKSAPPETTSQTTFAIPSFVSLPEGLLMMEGESGFKMDQIKFFKPPEDDGFFRDASKMIADEAYYFDDILDPGIYLPLEERRPLLDPLEWSLGTEGGSLETAGFRVFYVGPNRAQVRDKFLFLTEVLKDHQEVPPGPLIIRLAFAADHELVRCHIEQSSGIPQLDQNILRLLQGAIPPVPGRVVRFRGQLTIAWVDT